MSVIFKENQICHICDKLFDIYTFPLEEEMKIETCCGGRTVKRTKELITVQCHDCGITFKGYSLEEINKIIKLNRSKHLVIQLPKAINNAEESYRKSLQYWNSRKQEASNYIEGKIDKLSPRTVHPPEYYLELVQTYKRRLMEAEVDIAMLT